MRSRPAADEVQAVRVQDVECRNPQLRALRRRQFVRRHRFASRFATSVRIASATLFSMLFSSSILSA